MKRLAWAGLALVLLGLMLWGWKVAVLGPVPAHPVSEADGQAASGSAERPGRGLAGAPQEAGVMEARTSSGVRLRIERRPRIDIPDPPYAARVQELQAAADGGEPVAQYRLGLALYQCRDVPVDAAGLARSVEQIHQTRMLDGWDVSDPAQEERTLRTAYADCQGVPGQTRTRFRDLLRSAAEQGLMEAQLNLMFHLPQADYCQFIEDCTPEQRQFMAELREEARVNVHKALAGGSVEALRTVGGWALNEEMGTPDDVEAYAHFSAYDQIQQATGRERELGAMLAGIRKRLRPVDLERAETRARELLSNPKCCVLTR